MVSESQGKLTMTKRSILGTKEGQSEQRTTLDSEGVPRSTMISSSKLMVPCLYHASDTYHTLLCNLLWKVFLNFLALCKIFEGRAHLYTPLHLSNYKKKLVFNWLSCPKPGLFFYQVGVWAKLKCIWGKETERKGMKINHVIWPYHFSRIALHVSTFKGKYFLLQKIYKQRAVKRPILLHSNNTFAD